MHAEYFSVERQASGNRHGRRRVGADGRLRQVHRWTSIAFTLAVVANFAAITIGPVPAAVTYAPLPPLLVMTLTGLFMLTRHFGRARRRVRSIPRKG